MRLMSICFLMLLCRVVMAQEQAGEVLKIFEKRCVACHGPALDHPRGKFGHITDLSRLVTEAKLLVPGKPLDSELFLLISEGEMPPRKSSSAPMPKDEIQVVGDWIASGAILPDDWPVGAAVGADVSSSWSDEVAWWIGRLHPFVIHFPIGLIVAITFGQAFCRQAWVTQAVRYGLRLGAAGAVGAAVSGWFWAQTVSASQTLTQHRWAGVTAAILAVGLVILETRRKQNPRWFGVLLWITTILILIVGHLGGTLVHGPLFE